MGRENPPRSEFKREEMLLGGGTTSATWLIKHFVETPYDKVNVKNTIIIRAIVNAAHGLLIFVVSSVMGLYFFFKLSSMILSSFAIASALSFFLSSVVRFGSHSGIG